MSFLFRSNTTLILALHVNSKKWYTFCRSKTKFSQQYSAMKRSLWDNSTIQLLFGLWTRFAYLCISVLLLPLMYGVHLFIPKEDRERWWRLVAKRSASVLLRLSRITLDIRTTIPVVPGPVVYASNHPSWMDGFINLHLVGPDLHSMVAPFKSFPFPFNLWMKNSGAIDVERDTYDHEHYPGAHTKEEAIQGLVDALRIQKSNVLIFPEGHVERLNKLHYIHTGAARIAIRARVPVVPISLIGMSAIKPDNLRARPGTLTVRFGAPLTPPVVSDENPYRHAVQEFTKKMEKAFLNLLPVQQLPDYLHDYKHETVAAFFDIDNTLYKGYVMQDFLKYLKKKKLIPNNSLRRIAFWMFLEKIGLLHHEQMMNLALHVMSGYPEHDVAVEAKRFFEEEAVHKLEHNTLTHLNDHKKAGHVVVLLTEVITPLAKQFERYFKLSTTLGTELEQKKGVYTGKVNTLRWKYGKKEALDEFVDKFAIDRKSSFYYADSGGDIPALSSVGHPIAVNPSSTLLDHAKNKKWEILK